MKLFQSFVNEHQKSCLSSSTFPVDASSNTEDNQREYELFKKIKATHPELKTEAWGLVSWKFEHKCQLPITDFIQFAENKLQNGFDCAFINPMIANEALYINVWEQGLHSGHHGIDKISSFLQKKIGPFFDCYMDSNTFALCNYFVGSPAFWEKYFAFTEKAISLLEAEASAGSDVGQTYAGSSHYVRDDQLSMKPFVIERLFSSFLSSRSVKSANYKYHLEHYQNKFGVRLGNFLYKHSENKNSGIRNRNQQILEKYNELRRTCYDQDFIKVTSALDDSLDIFLSKELRNMGF